MERVVRNDNDFLDPTSFFVAISDGNGEIPAHQGTSWSIARSDGENTMSITSAME